VSNKRVRRAVIAVGASVAMAGVGVVLTVGVISTATLVAMALPKPLFPWSRSRRGAA
jgi:hypothetical protein